MFCKSCGKEIPEGNELCDECAQANSSSTENTTAESTVNENTITYETETPEATVVNDNQYNTNNSNSNVNPNPKSKLAAGLLGIFLGSLGVHNFYLGYTTKGLIQLLVTLLGGVLTCGIASFAIYVWGLVEGIMILTGSINTDANGNPLKD